MYSISIAAEIIGVCTKTLRRWDKAKKIRCLRTLGGHRRFPIQEIRRILGGKKSNRNKYKRTTNLTDKCAIYGRVSSHKQKKRGDLARQIEALQFHAQKEKLELYKVYKDVG